jgi:uncharacterized protein YdeI (BOF family)
MRLTTTLAAMVLATGPALAQTAIADLSGGGGTEIAGTVTHVFGNRFVVEDATGSVLVETGPHWFHDIAMTVGEDVRVVGEPERGSLDAFRIVRTGGEAIEIRPADGPPPWAGGRRD